MGIERVGAHRTIADSRERLDAKEEGVREGTIVIECMCDIKEELRGRTGTITIKKAKGGYTLGIDIGDLNRTHTTEFFPFFKINGATPKGDWKQIPVLGAYLGTASTSITFTPDGHGG